MYQICVYVPLEDAHSVKSAMFRAGAGRIGNYEQCSFEVSGIGQFSPLAGSTPFIGKMGSLERVNEVKVEMVCEKSVIKEVIYGLKNAHPYETPAYHVFECLNF